MRALFVLNLLLLAASGLLALLGAWAGLVTGLAYRVAYPRSGRRGWRLALPMLWLLVSCYCFEYGIVRLRERYDDRQQGFPRRYYTWPQ